VLLAHGPAASAHWPDQAPHRIANLGPFRLEGGGVLENLKMTYVTHGKLNAAKDNAILFMHGFGLNHHQIDHLIGPGRPLDTEKYFIICSDQLGSTQTTFEHSSSPTNSGLKMAFPPYNGRDRIRAEHLLVTRELGIPRLLAVSGISLGAIHAIQFAVSYPDFMAGAIAIVGSTRFTTQAPFFGSLMASSIEACEGWRGGSYDENPKTCASNGLSVLIPYFYTRDWWEQYVDTPEAYTKWRNLWGDYYLDIQDTRDLYFLLMSVGRGWVGDTPGFNGDLDAALGSIKARTMYIASPQDQFFPPANVEADVKVIPGARAVWIDSVAGHLICCNADPQATWIMGEAIKAFLHELGAQRGDRK
jgi:homoserine O-acetyltransferase